MLHSAYRLKVQQIEQSCLFELTWGQGQQLNARLSYPSTLIGLYQSWQRAYLSFYKTAQIAAVPAEAPKVPEAPIDQENNASALRGRVIGDGDLAPAATTWRARLVQAEAKLLSEFHHWLQSPELYEIRKTIAHANQQLTEGRLLDLFLTCSPIDLSRLPWEAWELGSEFGAGSVRIVRTPPQIRSETVSLKATQRRGRARVLAILGDDTGLNFQADREAVKSLSRMAEVKFIGWQPGKSIPDVQAEICAALVDELGWDVLFFAGHSNETQMTGGELAIAPGVSLSVSEIASRLMIARERGLQFALFNSCSGLQIAESLIDLGFSQVAVMREPIHNRVAQEFLIGFLTHLAQYKDVHEALMAACQILKLDKNITYPSAYLLPSLFCHPGASFYQIPQQGWKQWVQQWTPKRYEAIACGVGLLLALLPSVQGVLLEQRILAQAIYRDVSGQVPAAEVPPVALVLVDDASTREDPRLTQPSPMSRSYLADLIRRLSQQKAKIIGIDFLLDRQAGNESELNQALQQAVTQQQTWFVFGTLYDSFDSQGIFTTEKPGISQPNWSLQAYVSLLPERVTLPFPLEDCRKTCPFAYLLSLIRAGQQDLNPMPQPQISNVDNLRTQLMNAIEQSGTQSKRLSFLQQARLSWLSVLTSGALQQVTLEPIIDFSIPPDRIYEAVSAWQVFKDDTLDLSHLSEQVVIIGAGDYVDGGEVEQGVLDLFPIPTAVTYWREHLPASNRAAFASSSVPSTYQRFYAGAEAHAYMVHHLLNQRLVIPIPTIWVLGVAVVLGKGASLLYQRYWQQLTQSQQRYLILGLVAATAFYSLASLQLYISVGVLIPWVLPSTIFWIYLLPILRRKPYV